GFAEIGDGDSRCGEEGETGKWAGGGLGMESQDVTWIMNSKRQQTPDIGEWESEGRWTAAV
ncbi:hypothetical protein OFB78_31080, partial [Escherichia coli]|nr:hypothetical protein [Escherichia coli]